MSVIALRVLPVFVVVACAFLSHISHVLKNLSGRIASVLTGFSVRVTWVSSVLGWWPWISISFLRLLLAIQVYLASSKHHELSVTPLTTSCLARTQNNDRIISTIYDSVNLGLYLATTQDECNKNVTFVSECDIFFSHIHKVHLDTIKFYLFTN